MIWAQLPNHPQNYTQNIDTLETRAGVQRVLQCHGSFATASCINCHMKVPGNAIESDIMQQKIPLCAVCAVKPVVLNVKVKKKGTKKKKKASPWEDDSEEEPDIPAYPPGIMKVGFRLSPRTLLSYLACYTYSQI